MKIALLCDIHLVSKGKLHRTVDPLDRLDQALAAVQKHAGDADLLVLLGDLAQDGEIEAYTLLKERVGRLLMPTRILIGNHDSREAILSAWPSLPIDENGFLQSSLVTPDNVLLFLDTAEAGTHTGHLCESRRQWLEQELEKAGSRPVFVFMHHPPAALEMRADSSKLEEAKEVATIFRRFGTVRQIVAGHTHRAATGSWEGIAWTCLHGTHVQNHLDYPHLERQYVAGPAHLGIMHINGGNCAIHFHDFLEPYALLDASKF